MTCGNCGNGGKCGGDCSKPSGWWDNEFGYNPYGYNQAPVVRPNWWNEQFAPQVIGVGAVPNSDETAAQTLEIEKCTEDVMYQMGTNGGIQDMYAAGYTYNEIREIVRNKCKEEILGATASVEVSFISKPVTMRTWVAALAFVGTATVGGLIGYMAGKKS